MFNTHLLSLLFKVDMSDYMFEFIDLLVIDKSVQFWGNPISIRFIIIINNCISNNSFVFKVFIKDGSISTVTLFSRILLERRLID